MPVAIAPPAPATGARDVAEPPPAIEEPDLLAGPLPEPERRDPGPNVWVCPDCRWLVPKKRGSCPRCGFVRTVNNGQSTEAAVAIILIFLIVLVAFIILLMLVSI